MPMNEDRITIPGVPDNLEVLRAGTANPSRGEYVWDGEMLDAHLKGLVVRAKNGFVIEWDEAVRGIVVREKSCKWVRRRDTVIHGVLAYGAVRVDDTGTLCAWFSGPRAEGAIEKFIEKENRKP